MTARLSSRGYLRVDANPHAGSMDAHARSEATLFERLCLLRALYARRADRDRTAVMSVEDAVRYAEVLLAAGTPPAERPA